MLKGLGQLAHRLLQNVKNAFAFIGQVDLTGQTQEQLHLQCRFKPTDPVADRTGGQAQFLRSPRETQMPGSHQKRMQVGKLVTVEPGTDARGKVEHGDVSEPKRVIRPDMAGLHSAISGVMPESSIGSTLGQQRAALADVSIHLVCGHPIAARGPDQVGGV